MQLSLGYQPSTLTCMFCGEAGATLPAEAPTGRTFEYNGRVRQVVIYGYRHEGCAGPRQRDTPVKGAGVR